MARLRFPGRPGQRFGRNLVRLLPEEAQNCHRTFFNITATIHRNLKQFYELVGESDEDEEFEGFLDEEIKTSHYSDLEFSPQSSIGSSQFSPERSVIPSRSRITRTPRKSYKDLLKYGRGAFSKIKPDKRESDVKKAVNEVKYGVSDRFTKRPVLKLKRLQNRGSSQGISDLLRNSKRSLPRSNDTSSEVKESDQGGEDEPLFVIGSDQPGVGKIARIVRVKGHKSVIRYVTPSENEHINLELLNRRYKKPHPPKTKEPAQQLKATVAVRKSDQTIAKQLLRKARSGRPGKNIFNTLAICKEDKIPVLCRKRQIKRTQQYDGMVTGQELDFLKRKEDKGGKQKTLTRKKELTKVKEVPAPAKRKYIKKSTIKEESELLKVANKKTKKFSLPQISARSSRKIKPSKRFLDGSFLYSSANFMDNDVPQKVISGKENVGKEKENIKKEANIRRTDKNIKKEKEIQESPSKVQQPKVKAVVVKKNKVPMNKVISKNLAKKNKLKLTRIAERKKHAQKKKKLKLKDVKSPSKSKKKKKKKKKKSSDKSTDSDSIKKDVGRDDSVIEPSKQDVDNRLYTKEDLNADIAAMLAADSKKRDVSAGLAVSSSDYDTSSVDSDHDLQIDLDRMATDNTNEVIAKDEVLCQHLTMLSDYSNAELTELQDLFSDEVPLTDLKSTTSKKKRKKKKKTKNCRRRHKLMNEVFDFSSTSKKKLKHKRKQLVTKSPRTLQKPKRFEDGNFEYSNEWSDIDAMKLSHRNETKSNDIRKQLLKKAKEVARRRLILKSKEMAAKAERVRHPSSKLQKKSPIQATPATLGTWPDAVSRQMAEAIEADRSPERIAKNQAQKMKMREKRAEVVPKPKSVRLLGRGPRIKHVCRRASIALGCPTATFLDLEEPSLSALPLDERDQSSVVDSDTSIDRAETSSPSIASTTSSPRTVSTRPPSKTGRNRKVRCKVCTGCMEEEDCRTCDNCLDKTKYGGRNKKKQCCRSRKCSNPQLAGNALQTVVQTKKPKVPAIQRLIDFDKQPDNNNQTAKKTKPFVANKIIKKGLREVLSSRQEKIENGSRLQQLMLKKSQTQQVSVAMHRIMLDYKTDCNVVNAWQNGVPILSSGPMVPRTVCYLCGSKGQHELLYCNVCCEPFHDFCLDEEDQPLDGETENWCCRNCKFCHVCGCQNNLLQCNKCKNTYHAECLGPNYPTKPSKRRKIWICTKCVKCKSCGATTPGAGNNATWCYDFSLCQDCGKLFDMGNYCSICNRCYEDDDYESKMMQCGSCDTWIHAKCEGLTDDLYNIMADLPENVPYLCPRCDPIRPAKWMTEIMEEMQAGFKNVITSLLNCKSATHLIKPKKNKARKDLNRSGFCDVRHETPTRISPRLHQENTYCTPTRTSHRLAFSEPNAQPSPQTGTTVDGSYSVSDTTSNLPGSETLTELPSVSCDTRDITMQSMKNVVARSRPDVVLIVTKDGIINQCNMKTDSVSLPVSHAGHVSSEIQPKSSLNSEYVANLLTLPGTKSNNEFQTVASSQIEDNSKEERNIFAALQSGLNICNQDSCKNKLTISKGSSNVEPLAASICVEAKGVEPILVSVSEEASLNPPILSVSEESKSVGPTLVSLSGDHGSVEPMEHSVSEEVTAFPVSGEASSVDLMTPSGSGESSRVEPMELSVSEEARSVEPTSMTVSVEASSEEPTAASAFERVDVASLPVLVEPESIGPTYLSVPLIPVTSNQDIGEIFQEKFDIAIRTDNDALPKQSLTSVNLSDTTQSVSSKTIDPTVPVSGESCPTALLDAGESDPKDLSVSADCGTVDPVGLGLENIDMLSAENSKTSVLLDNLGSSLTTIDLSMEVDSMGEIDKISSTNLNVPFDSKDLPQNWTVNSVGSPNNILSGNTAGVPLSLPSQILSARLLDTSGMPANILEDTINDLQTVSNVTSGLSSANTASIKDVLSVAAGVGTSNLTLDLDSLSPSTCTTISAYSDDGNIQTLSETLQRNLDMATRAIDNALVTQSLTSSTNGQLVLALNPSITPQDVSMIDLTLGLPEDISNLILQSDASLQELAVAATSHAKEKPERPSNFLMIKTNVDTMKYLSVSDFIDDCVAIMQESISNETVQTVGLKRNNIIVREQFLQVMEKMFPWCNVLSSKCWKKNHIFPDGMLPNAVLPPHVDHEYAQWQQRTLSAPKTPQPSPLKKVQPSAKKPVEENSELEAFDFPLPPESVDDPRRCALCGGYGDHDPDLAGRLLYSGQDDWIHINCGLWSAEVFEEMDGSLVNVHAAISRGRLLRCELCERPGATVGCNTRGCPSNYHFMCAREKNALFLEDKKVFCWNHGHHADKELVEDGHFGVLRRVCVSLDNMKMNKSFAKGLIPVRVNAMIGSFTVEFLGRLGPLSDCKEALYPIGYRCCRVYWSTVDPGKRCVYTIKIIEVTPETSPGLSSLDETNNTLIHNIHANMTDSTLTDVTSLDNESILEMTNSKSSTDLQTPEIIPLEIIKPPADVSLTTLTEKEGAESANVDSENQSLVSIEKPKEVKRLSDKALEVYEATTDNSVMIVDEDFVFTLDESTKLSNSYPMSRTDSWRKHAKIPRSSSWSGGDIKLQSGKDALRVSEDHPVVLNKMVDALNRAAANNTSNDVLINKPNTLKTNDFSHTSIEESGKIPTEDAVCIPVSETVENCINTKAVIKDVESNISMPTSLEMYQPNKEPDIQSNADGVRNPEDSCVTSEQGSKLLILNEETGCIEFEKSASDNPCNDSEQGTQLKTLCEEIITCLEDKELKGVADNSCIDTEKEKQLQILSKGKKRSCLEEKELESVPDNSSIDSEQAPQLQNKETNPSCLEGKELKSKPPDNPCIDFEKGLQILNEKTNRSYLEEKELKTVPDNSCINSEQGTKLQVLNKESNRSCLEEKELNSIPPDNSCNDLNQPPLKTTNKEKNTRCLEEKELKISDDDKKSENEPIQNQQLSIVIEDKHNIRTDQISTKPSINIDISHLLRKNVLKLTAKAREREQNKEPLVITCNGDGEVPAENKHAESKNEINRGPNDCKTSIIRMNDLDNINTDDNFKEIDKCNDLSKDIEVCENDNEPLECTYCSKSYVKESFYLKHVMNCKRRHLMLRDHHKRSLEEISVVIADEDDELIQETDERRFKRKHSTNNDEPVISPRSRKKYRLETERLNFDEFVPESKLDKLDISKPGRKSYPMRNTSSRLIRIASESEPTEGNEELPSPPAITKGLRVSLSPVEVAAATTKEIEKDAVVEQDEPVVRKRGRPRKQRVNSESQASEVAHEKEISESKSPENETSGDVEGGIGTRKRLRRSCCERAAVEAKLQNDDDDDDDDDELPSPPIKKKRGRPPTKPFVADEVTLKDGESNENSKSKLENDDDTSIEIDVTSVSEKTKDNSECSRTALDVQNECELQIIDITRKPDAMSNVKRKCTSVQRKRSPDIQVVKNRYKPNIIRKQPVREVRDCGLQTTQQVYMYVNKNDDGHTFKEIRKPCEPGQTLISHTDCRSQQDSPCNNSVVANNLVEPIVQSNLVLPVPQIPPVGDPLSIMESSNIPVLVQPSVNAVTVMVKPLQQSSTIPTILPTVYVKDNTQLLSPVRGPSGCHLQPSSVILPAHQTVSISPTALIGHGQSSNQSILQISNTLPNSPPLLNYTPLSQTLVNPVSVVQMQQPQQQQHLINSTPFFSNQNIQRSFLPNISNSISVAGQQQGRISVEPLPVGPVQQPSYSVIIQGLAQNQNNISSRPPNLIHPTQAISMRLESNEKSGYSYKRVLPQKLPIPRLPRVEPIKYAPHGGNRMKTSPSYSLQPVAQTQSSYPVASCNSSILQSLVQRPLAPAPTHSSSSVLQAIQRRVAARTANANKSTSPPSLLQTLGCPQTVDHLNSLPAPDVTEPSNTKSMTAIHRFQEKFESANAKASTSSMESEAVSFQPTPPNVQRKIDHQPSIQPVGLIHKKTAPRIQNIAEKQEVISPLLARMEKGLDESSPPPPKHEPHLVFEVTSDDGFSTRADSMEDAWKQVVELVNERRNDARMKSLSFTGVHGLAMLGITNNAMAFLIEQLFGAPNCRRYRFRFHQYHRPDDKEEELPINPNGCARAEPFKRTRFTYDMFDFLASKHRKPPPLLIINDDDDSSPYGSSRRHTSIDLPMAMRFRHLKNTAKEAVGVFRSMIHGRGLFCKRLIETGEMIIEYSGTVIRSILTDKREKYYESKGIGCYMFRIDNFDVIDATVHGNAARFINHSCEPNCYSRVITIDGNKHIVIFASREINVGEELTYDYKFPIEDVKLPCNCASRKCRKYLN